VKLLENLRYVVVDELHSLRGLRLARRQHPAAAAAAVRVLRLAAAVRLLVGHDRHPRELAEASRARHDARGPERRPRGERYFAIYNPPVVNRQLGIRKSALNSARDVSLSFLSKGLQTIVFARRGSPPRCWSLT